MLNNLKNENILYLIDGSGYVFRAYYAVKSLIGTNGIPLNAVYGFIRMLFKFLRNYNPKYFAIAFDTKAINFRKKLFKDYKANRISLPKDLIPQFEIIHKFVNLLNIKLLLKDGYEADDLIGTAAKMAKVANKKVVIVTSDKDFMQLVNSDISLLYEIRTSKIRNNVIIDTKYVMKKFGVLPKNIIDIFALAGDTADNIPGVPGIGIKIATQLVQEYGSLENVLNVASLIKQKSRRENIIKYKDMALLSKKLFIIDCNVCYPMMINDFKKKKPFNKDVLNMFKNLGFNSLLRDNYINKYISNK